MRGSIADRFKTLEYGQLCPAHAVLSTKSEALLKIKGDEPRKVGGYATRYGRAHYFEGKIDVFMRGCFDKSLAEKHLVRFVEDHDDNRTFVTTESHRLELRSDEAGLAFIAHLPSTAQGDRAYRLVKSCEKNAMSVRYRVEDAEFRDVGGRRVRFIKSAILLDVSIAAKGVVGEAFAQVLDAKATEPPRYENCVADIYGAAARLRHVLSLAS